jgi:hypothetical protein
LKKLFSFTLFALFLLVGCSTTSAPPSVTRQEQKAVENQDQVYANTQPTPFFDKSLDRALLIQIYKKRQEAVATWTYVQSEYTGKVLFFCPSIGFPIPGGTQLTNPNKIIERSYNGAQSNWGWGTAIPQSEPNGLYSPSTSEGTYVMCSNEDGSVSPAYLEPKVQTFFQPMIETNGTLTPAPKSNPSVKIDISEFKK